MAENYSDKEVNETLKNLTEREKKVLKERLGVDVSKGADLSHARKEIVITEERIKKIEERALKNLGRKKED